MKHCGDDGWDEHRLCQDLVDRVCDMPQLKRDILVGAIGPQFEMHEKVAFKFDRHIHQGELFSVIGGHMNG